MGTLLYGALGGPAWSIVRTVINKVETSIFPINYGVNSLGTGPRSITRVVAKKVFVTRAGSYYGSGISNGVHRTIYVSAGQICSSYTSGSYLTSLEICFPPRCRRAVSETAGMEYENYRVLGIFVSIREMPFGHNFCSISVAFFFGMALSTCSITTTPPRAIYKFAAFSGGYVLCNDRNGMEMCSSRFHTSSNSERVVPRGAGPETGVRITSPVYLRTELYHPYSYYSYLNSSYVPIPSYIGYTFNSRFPSSFNRHPIRGTITIAVNVFAVIRLRHSIRVLVPTCSFYVPSGRYDYSASSPYRTFEGVRFPISRFFPPGRAGLRANMDATAYYKYRHDR